MPIDRTDLRILAALQDDANLSTSELARRLDMPLSSCHRRLATLEASGVILRRVAIVDPEAVGLATVAFISIRTSRPAAQPCAPLTRARHSTESEETPPCPTPSAAPTPCCAR